MTRPSTPELTLTLTVDEINVILEGLGNLAFHRVFGLIGRIQEQSSSQLRPADTDAAAPLAMVASR